MTEEERKHAIKSLESQLVDAIGKRNQAQIAFCNALDNVNSLRKQLRELGWAPTKIIGL